MHYSALSRLRPALFGTLALVAVASSSVTYAAPADQASLAPDNNVRIDSFAFAPIEVSLPVGATLVWSNVQADVPHTTTSVDGVWDSGVVSTGGAFSFTFDQTGDFAYQCDIHPSMHGIVHVLADAGAQTDPGTVADSSAAGGTPSSSVVAAPSESGTATTPTGLSPTPAATVVPTVALTATPKAVAPAGRPTPAPYYGY